MSIACCFAPCDVPDMPRQRSLVTRGREQIAVRRRRVRWQYVALREKRAGTGNVFAAAGIDEHARQPRMKRQPLQAPAQLRDPAVRHRAELLEQRERGIDSIGRRWVEPFEASRIAAPRQDFEDGVGEFHAMDLCLGLRTETIGFIPQPPYDSRRETPRSTGALIRRLR